MRLAEEVCARVPSVEKLRLVSSGTEATMTAVRLARGVTGRDVILKFAGCYHGHADALLASAGSGLATLGLPGSAGVPAGAVAGTVVAPYNDEAALDEAFARHGPQLAAVIVEGVAANMGLVPPADGFLDGLRRRCSDRRSAADHGRGHHRASASATTAPRAATASSPTCRASARCWAAACPLAAFGGRAELMDHLAPLGPVYQAGTLSGNPLATAAGLAVLARLDAAAYATLEATATALADGLRSALAGAGVAAQVPRVGPLVGLFFSETPVVDYASAQARRRQALRPVLPRDARPGRLPGAEPVRSAVPQPRPRPAPRSRRSSPPRRSRPPPWRSWPAAGS